MSAFLAKFYEVIIYVLLALILVLIVGFCWQKYNRTVVESKFLNAEAKCNTEKAKIHVKYKEQADKEVKAYQEALAKQQTTINQLSSNYEEKIANHNVKVETVTKYVDKIIERDVYRNVCIDDDGMQQLNSLIKSRNTS